MCLELLVEARQTFQRIRANRAGIRAHDRQRRIGHEEDVLLQILQILEHLEEHDVLLHQDVVERLHVRFAILDGHAVAEANALDILGGKPLCAVLADDQAMIVRT